MNASVWHRPVVSEEVKDRLAARQAAGGHSSGSVWGGAEEVLPLLQHGADPRLRGFHCQLAQSALGADGTTLAAELARLDLSTTHAVRRHPVKI